MKSRIGLCLPALVVVLSILFTACGGSSSHSLVGVSLSQSGSTTTLNASGSAVILTATVTNDTKNSGVTWALSPSSGCGSLSLSGTTATYTPPAESSLNADCSATITATSAADSTKTAATTFSVKAIAVTIAQGNILTTAAGETTFPLSASIVSGTDASGSAVLNWSIVASTGSQIVSLPRTTLRQVSTSPARIQIPANPVCGSLSSTTGNSVIYTPPISGPCTDTITVATSVNPNVNRIFTINVNAALGISTTTLGTGTYGSTYGSTQLQASGGIAPYTWHLANGSILPVGLTLTTGGLLSGTPTTSGTYNVTFSATDSNTWQPYTTSSQILSLTVNKASLTVTANNQAMSYGGTPTLTAAYNGFVNGDTQTALSGSPTLTTTGSSSSAPGTYPITAAQGTLTAANYIFSAFNPGTLTINKASLTATVTAASKIYDGTAAASITGCTLTGVLPADAGNVSCSATTASFSSASAGTGKTVTATGISLSGTAAGNYQLSSTTANATANITAVSVTPNVTAASKSYDGTSAATLTGCTLTGVLAGDTGNVSCAAASASFPNANAGPGKTVTATGISLSGGAAGNYQLSSTTATATANITPVALAVTAANMSKTYGQADPAYTVNYTGFVNGETSSVLSGAPGFAVTGTAGTSRPVGTYTITPSLGTLTATNYTFGPFNTGTLTVNGVPVTATVTAANKTYDRTAAATLTGCTLAGVLPADSGNVNCAATSASFANANAGTGKTVTATGISLSGGAAGNYQLTSTTATTTANITPLQITVTLGVASKTYDGTTNAVLQSCMPNGVLPGDFESCGVLGSSYADANVGTGKTVTVTGITLFPAGNYVTPTTQTTTANINPVALTVTAANANKIYGQPDPTYTANYTGFVNGETSSVLSGAPGFAVTGTAGTSRPVGTYTITPSVGTLTATNYTFGPFVNGTLTVNGIPVTATVTAANKPYDGTATATLTGCTLAGVLPADAGNVNCAAASASFSSAAVGTGKTVTASGISLSGTASGNYQLTSTTATTTANITPLPVTATVTAANKTYDGTSTATITSCTPTGVLLADAGNVSCTAASATFASVFAGTGTTVNVTGITLSGTASANYQLTSNFASTAADITRAPLTVTAANVSKTYGQPDPTYTVNYTGFVNGENSSVVSGTPGFAVTGTAGTARPVGTYTITPSVGTLSAINYSFVPFNTGTLTVTGIPVTASITAANKTYDGTTVATVTNCALTGVLLADTGNVSCAATAANFSSATAGVGKTVTATGISLSGTASGNYQLTSTTATNTADISLANLTVTANNISWAQGGTWPPAFTANYSGFVNGETVAVLGGAPAFNTTATSSSPVGTYPITVGTGTLASANYSFSFLPGTLTITAAPLNITTTSLPNGVSGTTYSQQLNATGGALPLQWSTISGSLPTGITLSSGGLISGTTGLSGTFNFTVQAQDSGVGAQQQTRTQSLSLIINPALVINTASLPNGNTGMPYSQQLSSSGGSGSINWSVTVGSLPTGITLSSGGLISGTTNLSGTFNFTVQAQDSGTPQQTVTKALSLTINQAIFVSLSPNSPQSLDAGGTLQITPTVTNDASNNGVNFTFAPLTGCGSVSPTNNVVSGTAVTYTAPPSLANPCQITVTATSVTDNTKTAQLTINVNLALGLPSPSPSIPGSATQGGSYTGFINASGGTGPYNWTITGLPADGLSATNSNGNTLTISGTPTTAQTVTFTAQVQDVTGAQAGPFTYSIVVNAPTPLSLPSNNPNPLPPATTNVAYNGGINANGGVPGYTFTVNGNPVPTNGTPVAVGGGGLTVSNSGGNTLIFGGTPTVAGTVNVNVSVTDSASHTAGPTLYTINVTNPTPLTINTTQKDVPNGGINLPYSAFINATGGSGNPANYVFSTINGTNLPPGLNWSATCKGCIVGSPTTAGTYNFTVQVTDSTVNVTPATASYTIVISNGPDGSNNRYLYGHYAFLFRGFVDNTNGGNALYQTAAIGSFFADGAGNITGGRFLVNDGNNKVSNSSPGFTGTYSIGADSRGVITLNTCVTSTTCAASSNIFVFSVGQIENVNLVSGSCPVIGGLNNCPLYNDGRMIEFDDAGTTPSGVHGGARLFRQSLGQYNTLTAFQSNVPGNWVFGFEGEDTTFNTMASAGVFTLSPGTNDGTTVTGAIPSGTADINDNQVLNSTPLSLGGSDTYASNGATTATGLFNGTLTVSGAPTGSPTNYRFVMINTNRLIGMSWDPHSGGTPSSLVSGILYKQKQASYSNASMPPSGVTYMSGSGTGYSDAIVLQTTCNATGACTINASDENNSGIYTQNGMAGFVFQSTVASNGRVSLGPVGQAPIFYLYDSSATGGGVALNTSGVQLGNLFAQGSVPSLSGLAGSYYMGELFALEPFSGSGVGALTVDGSGNVSGTSDNAGAYYTSYGETIAGMTIPSISANGVFGIGAGGQTQVVCYTINPVCSGGAAACGGSSNPPYANYACMDPGSNNPKITIVQQVQ